MTGNNDTRAYLDDLKARARRLRAADAFAPAGSAAKGPDPFQVDEDLRADRRAAAARAAVCAAVCVAVVLVSLLLPAEPDWFNQFYFYPPSVVADAYGTAFQMWVAPLIDPTQSNLAASAQGRFVAEHGAGAWENIVGRGKLTLLTVICAWMLACSGLLFQTSFKNPLAAPSSLGVADGVALGFVVFILLGNTVIENNPPLFYACTYGCGIAVVLFVLFASRFVAGARTYNVLDMLLIGTVIAQMVGGIVTFVSNYGMDYDTWLAYYDLLQGVDFAEYDLTYAIAGAVAVLSTIPVVVLRFRMNMLSFPDDEARMAGVQPGALRWVALAAGSLMQLTALASLGAVSLVSLAVPFLARYLFPADFLSQMAGNFLVGVPVLLVCQMISHFVVLNQQPMPLGAVVGLVVLPLFIWLMALQRRGWE